MPPCKFLKRKRERRCNACGLRVVLWVKGEKSDEKKEGKTRGCPCNACGLCVVLLVKGEKAMKTQKMRPDAFMEDAIARYGDMVYRMAMVHTGNQEDAKDVFQEVFLNLMQTDTDFACGELLKAWLLRATLHRSRDLLTTAYRRHRASLTEAASIPFSQQEDADVWQAVQKLPPKYRDVLHLYYLEGYNTAEIASILGKRPATVRSRMHRARRMLQAELGGILDETEPLQPDGRTVPCRRSTEK